MSNHLYKLVFLSLPMFFISTYSAPAKAQFFAAKFDVSGSAANVMGSVENIAQNVNTKVQTVSETAKNYTVGGLDSLTAKPKSFLETGKALKADVTKAHADITGAIEKGKSTYEDEADSLAEVNPILENNYKEAKKACEQKEAAEKQKLEAQRAALTANLEAYQQQYAEAQGNNDTTVQESLMIRINEAQADLNKINGYLANDASFQAYLSQDETYVQLLANYNDLKDKRNKQREKIKKQLLGLGATFIAGLLKMSDSDREAQYSDVIAKNFLAEGELAATKRQEELMNYRRKVLQKEIGYALDKGLERKIKMVEDAKESEKIAGNIYAVDYKQTSANLLIQQRIQDIDLLYNYTDLLIAKMRMKTAHALISNSLSLTDYSRNPAVFNFDNYIFTEKDVIDDSDKKNSFDPIVKKAMKGD